MHRGSGGPAGREARQGLRAHRETRVPRVIPALKVPRVIPALKVPGALRVLRDRLGLRVR